MQHLALPHDIDNTTALQHGMHRRQPPARQLQGPWRLQVTDAEKPAVEPQRIENLRNEGRTHRTPGIIIRTC